MSHLYIDSQYIEWLRHKRVAIYRTGETYWRLYQGALVPAYAHPFFVHLNREEAMKLIKESGARFLRYSSHPCEYKTEWWYIVCDKYDPKTRSAKTRQNINRGKRSCSVNQLDTKWLANYGYECYSSAYERYQNAYHDSKDVFRTTILSTVDGPFEYWGVFVGEILAGYCQCIVDGNNVITSITKYNPEFLVNRTAYALIDHLISHYVINNKMVLSNGTRSISHDTNYQDVLINIGFRKQFCRLNVIYRPWIALILKLTYPLRKTIRAFPNNGFIHKFQSVLFQEELRRSF